MTNAETETPRSILVIRRDNIGDLLCTTPLLSALRERYPQAWIGVLANRYNAPVLAGNPDIDACFAYQKAKHRNTGESRLGVWWRTWRLLAELRAKRIDYAIIASSGFQSSALRFARLVRPRHVLGYGLPGQGIDHLLAAELAHDGHEVEATLRLLQPMGIAASPGPMRLSANKPVLEGIARRPEIGRLPRPLVGLHLSARKPRQRWPEERFVELARQLVRNHGVGIVLMWAPGSANDPQHPGDDEKAERVLAALDGLPVAPVATRTLEELIAALSLCDRVVLADGGAMHIAAALGKPVVCFFGNSDASRWHPWGVPYELLQKDSRDVCDISVDEALAAYARLASNAGA